VTIDDVRAFWETYYVAGGVFPIILGPDVKKARRMAEKALDGIPQRDPPELVYDKSDRRPLLRGVVEETIVRDIQTFHLMIGFPTDPWGNKFDETMDVKAERLEFKIERELRDRNLIPRLSTYHPRVIAERTWIHGMFYVWIPLNSLEGVKRAEEVVLQEIKDMRQGKFLEIEMEERIRRVWRKKGKDVARRIQKRLRQPLIQVVETHRLRRPVYDDLEDAFVNMPHFLFELVADCVCNGDENLETLNGFPALVGAVDKRMMVAAANEYLDTTRYAKVVVVPKNPIDICRYKLRA
jgi:phosphoribosylformylglycinamidine (FGAM) synthase PurS component